jgi:hypothetical protein
MLSWPPSPEEKLFLTAGVAILGLLVVLPVRRIVQRASQKAADAIERQAAEAMHRQKEESTACATRDLQAGRITDELYFRDALGRFLPAAIERCNAIMAWAEQGKRDLNSPAAGMIPSPTATGGPFTLLTAEATEDAAAMEDAARICLKRHFVRECIIPDPEASLSCMDSKSLKQAMRKDGVLRDKLDQAERDAIENLGFEQVAIARAQQGCAPEDCFPGLDHASWTDAYRHDVILLRKTEGVFDVALPPVGGLRVRTLDWKAASQALVLLRYRKDVTPSATSGVGP